MYHNHTTMGVLGRKMRAILSSFLLSATPPKVQVSVPSEVADQTILKMDKMGPYIFREAQVGEAGVGGWGKGRRMGQDGQSAWQSVRRCEVDTSLTRE